MTVEMLKPPSAAKRAPRHDFDRDQTPGRISIAGHTYRVVNMSADGLIEVDFSGDAEPNQVLPATMHFPFPGFDFSMPVTCEVISNAPQRSRLVMQVAQSGGASDRSPFKIAVDAMRAGEIVSPGEILELAQQNKKAGPPPLPEPPAQTRLDRVSEGIRRRIGAIVFAILAATLLAYIGYNILNRFLVVQADGAIVNPRSALLRMPVAGEVLSYSAPVGSRVAANAPVATLRSGSGEAIVVRSACDCVIVGYLADGRAFLNKGEPLAHLVPVDGTNKAMLSVELDDLRRVRIGDRVVASFYDSGTKAVGTVERVRPPKLIAGRDDIGSRSRGTVEVRFTTKVPAWRVGEPVSARIGISPFSPIG